MIRNRCDTVVSNCDPKQLTNRRLLPDVGKIQGDGRKFLDHFKSYCGSQIPSQSLNEVHIYGLQPKSATKGDFFSYIFVFDCFKSASRIANDKQSQRSAAR